MLENHDLTIDAALKHIKDDKLMRKKFASDIAQVLLKLTKEKKESIVLGLYGEWGSGKSSIINFIKETIDEMTLLPQKALLMKFKNELDSSLIIKWLKNNKQKIYSTIEFLLKVTLTFVVFKISFYNFLTSFEPIRVFSTNIDKSLPDFLNLHLLKIGLEFFIKILITCYLIIAPLLNLLAPLKLLSKPFVYIWDFLIIKTHQKYKINKPIIIDFIPWNLSDEKLFLKEFFKQLSDAIGASIDYTCFQEISKLLGEYSNLLCNDLHNEQSDLFAVKKELEEKLKQKDCTIIVFIDEIDRLSDSEIYMTMKLVNSIANLPNIVYFLSLDKSVVAKALEQLNKGNGEDFLEKIIQVAFEMPIINHLKLNKFLFEKIDEVIDYIPEVSKNWQNLYQSYFGEIYNEGFREFFASPRDVIRYTNTLKILYNNSLQSEINPVDFLAIISIQIFTPKLYKFIAENKNGFLGLSSINPLRLYEGRNNEENPFKENLDTLISEIVKCKNSKIKDLLLVLFPRLKSIYKNTSYGNDWERTWRSEGRICSKDNFDKFFMYDIPEGEISLAEMKQIVAESNNQNYFSNLLLDLNTQNKIKTFLERLEDYTESKIPIENIETIISTLLDLGDYFPLSDEGFYSFDIYVNIDRIILQLLGRELEPEYKFEIIKNSIINAKSIYPSISCVSLIERSFAKPEIEQNFASLDQSQELINITLEKMYDWSSNDIKDLNDGDLPFNGRLLEHHRFVRILYFWKKYGNNEELSNYVKAMSGSDNDLINLLVHFLWKQKSMSASSYHEAYKIDKGTLESFFVLDELKDRLNKISKDTEAYNEQEKLAITESLKAVNSKDRYGDLD